MKQQFVHLHSRVNQNGVLTDINLDDEIKKLENGKWVVKQIASSSSSNIIDARGTTTFVHLFLLTEKP